MGFFSGGGGVLKGLRLFLVEGKADKGGCGDWRGQRVNILLDAYFVISISLFYIF